MSALNEDKPSTSPDFWVYYDGLDESRYSVNPEGKWMLFYPKEELDVRWVDACSHFDANRFPCVCAMKVSTLRPNPRASDPNKGVIILYTPYMSEHEQKQVGYAIVSSMGYEERMYYKTDNQTRHGTKATGQTRNHTYSVKWDDLFVCPDVFANVDWD